jgi:hypothetical protein
MSRVTPAVSRGRGTGSGYVGPPRPVDTRNDR